MREREKLFDNLEARQVSYKALNHNWNLIGCGRTVKVGGQEKHLLKRIKIESDTR